MSDEKDNVIELPVEKVYPMYRGFDREMIFPDEVVWAVCPWLRHPNLDDIRCRHCPRLIENEHYGKVHPGCYLLAEEVCQVVVSKGREISCRSSTVERGAHNTLAPGSTPGGSTTLTVIDGDKSES